MADDYRGLVQFASGPPSHWIVLLNDGSRVDVWADSVTGLSGDDDPRDYEFGCLMDVDPELQDQFMVTARTPSNPSRVEVQVARFPRAAVQDVYSA